MKKEEYPCFSLSYIHRLEYNAAFFTTHISALNPIFLGFSDFFICKIRRIFSACQHIASLVVGGGISDPSRVRMSYEN